jgi:hypothetical protein
LFIIENTIYKENDVLRIMNKREIKQWGLNGYYCAKCLLTFKLREVTIPYGLMDAMSHFFCT